MICYLGLAGLAALIYITVIHVYIKLLLMKLKLGRSAIISFMPMYGDYFWFNKSLEKYRDSLAMYQKRFIANPQIKFVLTNIMHKVNIIIYDPEYYKSVLVQHEKYSKVEIFYHPKLSSTSILFGEPQKVKQQRNLLGESFTFEKLKQRTPVINEVLLDKLEHYDYKKQDLLLFLTKTSSDIIIKTFFCKELQEIIIQGNDITTEMIEIITEIGRLQMFDFYVGGKFALLGRKSFDVLLSKKEKQLNQRIDRLIDDTLMPIIKNKIANYQKTSNYDFIDIYIEAFLNQKPGEPKITELELCQIFVSIVSAGTDTSSHQIALTLYYLAINKEAQNEIRKELEQVVGQEKEIKPEHLKNLVLLNAFIQESFRIRNTVIQPLTRIAKETHYIKDLKIEKGMFVAAFTQGPSWSEKYFNDPLKFDYKRWLTDSPIKEDNGYVFVPFSAGGRNCIGQHMAMMTMKIMIGQILRTHEIVVDPTVQVSFPLVVFVQYHPKDLVQIVKLKQ